MRAGFGVVPAYSVLNKPQVCQQGWVFAVVQKYWYCDCGQHGSDDDNDQELDQSNTAADGRLGNRHGKGLQREYSMASGRA